MWYFGHCMQTNLTVKEQKSGSEVICKITFMCFQSMEWILIGNPVLLKEQESIKVWSSQYMFLEVYHGIDKDDFWAGVVDADQAEQSSSSFKGFYSTLLA